MSRKVKANSDGDILGNAAHFVEQAKTLVRILYRWSQATGSENHLRSITIYPPSAARNGMWLIVGKAWSGGYKLVSFHRATDPLTALVGFLSRVEQGKATWKEDSYAEEVTALKERAK